MRTFVILVTLVGIAAGIFIGTYNTGPGTQCAVMR